MSAPEKECVLDSDCGSSGYRTKCCAKTVMYEPKTDTKDVRYQCLNRGMVNGQVSMVLNDFNLEMKCENKDGAIKLATGVVALASLVATLMF